MIEVETRTAYYVRCDWQHCQTGGPRALSRRSARSLATGEGWKVVTVLGRRRDICPRCYAKYGKDKIE